MEDSSRNDSKHKLSTNDSKKKKKTPRYYLMYLNVLEIFSSAKDMEMKLSKQIKRQILTLHKQKTTQEGKVIIVNYLIQLSTLFT